MIAFSKDKSNAHQAGTKLPVKAGSHDTTAKTTSNTQAAIASTAQAALTAAGSTPKAAETGHKLDTQQTALSKDLLAAMKKAGVKMSGDVKFTVGSDGTMTMKGSDKDKAAMSAFLKGDTTRPSLTTRMTTQLRDASKLSATIQQNAAISQAARYGAQSGGVTALYKSLMQQTSPTAAVMTVSATSSSLTYPGALNAKA